MVSIEIACKTSMNLFKNGNLTEEDQTTYEVAVILSD